MTFGSAIKVFAGYTRVVLMRLRLGIRCRTAKSKMHDFAKPKKQAIRSAIFASGKEFQFLSDLLF